jgi:trehalose/maltose transport system permease protein
VLLPLYYAVLRGSDAGDDRSLSAMFWKGLFWVVVALIVIIAVFPFYYAILSSLESGTALFRPNLLPGDITFANYEAVLGRQSFIRSVGNSVFIAGVTVIAALFLAVTASYALARVRFRGRGLLLMTILGVSMFPQIAVLSGLFELVNWLGVYNTPWALIISYTIFTLPFTVWVLTTFMRDLPVEIEEAAIVDGASPWVIISRVFLPLLWPALVTTGAPGIHRRLERVPVRPDLHRERDAADGAGCHRAPVGRLLAGDPLGDRSWRRRCWSPCPSSSWSSCSKERSWRA